MKKHELLEKAMKDYPSGTKIYSTSGNGTSHETQMPYCIDECGSVQDNYGWLIYYKGIDKWADIVPLKPTFKFICKSECGNDLYENSPVHTVWKEKDLWVYKRFYTQSKGNIRGNYDGRKLFCTKEAAESWIEEANKPEEIEIYDKSELIGTVNINGFTNRRVCPKLSTEAINDIFMASQKLIKEHNSLS